MKNIILFFLIILLSQTIFAQKNIPTEIIEKFKSIFPNAENAKFTKEKDGTFEVDFMENSIQSSAKLSAASELLETERHLTEENLPDSIKDMLSKDYNGWDVENCEKVELIGKEAFYEVFIEKGKENFELKIDDSGIVFEKSKTKKSESDD